MTSESSGNTREGTDEAAVLEMQFGGVGLGGVDGGRIFGVLPVAFLPLAALV